MEIKLTHITVSLNGNKKEYDIPDDMLKTILNIGKAETDVIIELLPFLSDEILKDSGMYDEKDDTIIKNAKKFSILINMMLHIASSKEGFIGPESRFVEEEADNEWHEI